MEIDLILEALDGSIVAIEVKASKNLQLKDFKGLKFLKENYSNHFKAGIVLYMGDEIIKIENDIVGVPLSILF